MRAWPTSLQWRDNSEQNGSTAIRIVLQLRLDRDTLPGTSGFIYAITLVYRLQIRRVFRSSCDSLETVRKVKVLVFPLEQMRSGS